jgi:hypothetical protein
MVELADNAECFDQDKDGMLDAEDKHDEAACVVASDIDALVFCVYEQQYDVPVSDVAFLLGQEYFDSSHYHHLAQFVQGVGH